MAQVPDRILAWLWSVTQNYRYRELVNGDVVNALAVYTVLKPKTATFTYENGHAALLLCLTGSISVTFRGTPYRYPLDIWLPEGYGEPGVAVQCFVRCTDGTVIRPGQHVAHDGKIYHPYLSAWNHNPQPSSVVEFLSILQDVFSREPPLAAARSTNGTTQVQSTSGPPLPPKGTSRASSAGGESAFGSGSSVSRMSLGVSSPLPLSASQPVSSDQGHRTSSPLRSIHNAAPPSRYAAPLALPTTQTQARRTAQYTAANPSLNSTIPYGRDPYLESVQPQSSIAYDMYDMQQAMPRAVDQAIAVHDHRLSELPTAASTNTQAPPQSQLRSTPHVPSFHQATPRRDPKPQHDLLTDPFDVSLPNVISPTSQPPPIPPNPEREHICVVLSDMLTGLANAKIERNRAALAPLQAQNRALSEAHAKLTAELEQVQGFDATLSNNEPILHQSLQDCDSVIASSKTLPEPDIDETLVAPTVAAQQLWGLCADEVAIREAMWCLQRAIGAGRISGADFVKLTRGLGREAFLKMALIRKISTGLGLDTGVMS